MDLCLDGLNHGLSAEAVATAAELTPAQVELAWQGIQAKRRTTRYLHLAPLLVEPVAEIH